MSGLLRLFFIPFSNQPSKTDGDLSGYPCLCVGKKKKTSKPMTLKRYFVYVFVCNLRLGRTSLSFFYLASPKIA